MPEIRQDVDLKPLNTFGISAQARYYTELHTVAEFAEVQQTEIFKNQPVLIIGGGSNLLFTKDFEGLVIRNCLKGISVEENSSDSVLLRVSAGEVWHELVMWTIAQGYAGLENLSLIPGCVGASPMQNIGAYGVEIKEVFEKLEALSMRDGSLKSFDKKACEFGYRESVFKRKYKNQFMITAVYFRLKKNAAVNTSYGAITAQLQEMGVTQPSIKDVSDAVIAIRRSKLPDPAVTGNAGSFFKNPEISAELYKKVHSSFPDVVAYPLADGRYKLAAGWLIEQAGLKGFEIEGAAVHLKQALVLINKGGATGNSVLRLSEEVIKRVKEKYGVELEREVNIV
jgi:UDP-N-acetylmuramate dehydrogenase